MSLSKSNPAILKTSMISAIILIFLTYLVILKDPAGIGFHNFALSSINLAVLFALSIPVFGKARLNNIYVQLAIFSSVISSASIIINITNG